MDEEEHVFLAELHLRDQIHFVMVIPQNVREDLFVEKLDTFAPDVSRELRQEQLHKLKEERRQQSLKQAIMVDSVVGHWRVL